MGLTVKPFGVTIGVKNVYGGFLAAVEDGVDGELSGDVFHLAAAEVIGRCQGGTLVFGEVWKHCVPDLFADCGIGSVKADLVEEAALKGGIQVLGEVGGCNHDSV